MSTTATTDPAELAALVSAQRAMIRHAMEFPNVPSPYDVLFMIVCTIAM
jgi:hypothetical protein